MTPFVYHRADDPEAAARAAAAGALYLGGGTNLVDLLRHGIQDADALVDVSSLSTEIRDAGEGGLLVGAGVTNTTLASHPEVRRRYPVLSQAILNGASGQIRNMATVGGNLMQRTRCLYFYDLAAACNKRQPGAGCDAIGGFNHNHAILGASPHCVATHPSDMCVALSALGATVHVGLGRAARQIPITEFHRLPGDTPQTDTRLEPGELITAVELPPLPFASRSAYRKVRERASYAFALVAVAVALDLEGDVVRDARIALGGVAHKPWRALEAEDRLRGSPATRQAFEAAAALAVSGAAPLAQNAFKVPLARRTIVAVLEDLTRTQDR